MRSTLGKIKRFIIPPKKLGRVSQRCPTQRLGSDYGGWTFNPTVLGGDSVVYSAGIGDDISFDLALIRLFGVTVHGFDPTPRSIAWVASQKLPAQFVMHGYGLGSADGSIVFHEPENAAHISLSVLERTAPTGRLSLPVRELGGIMRELGHERIDLLKMDIEGAEYAVIEDLLARQLPVRQLLVEYHHRFPGVGDQATRASIELLERHGYRLFYVSSTAEEYSFLRA
jgi:FkbM family methyltransferase